MSDISTAQELSSVCITATSNSTHSCIFVGSCTLPLVFVCHDAYKRVYEPFFEDSIPKASLSRCVSHTEYTEEGVHEKLPVWTFPPVELADVFWNFIRLMQHGAGKGERAVVRTSKPLQWRFPEERPVCHVGVSGVCNRWSEISDFMQLI